MCPRKIKLLFIGVVLFGNRFVQCPKLEHKEVYLMLIEIYSFLDKPIKFRQSRIEPGSLEC